MRILVTLGLTALLACGGRPAPEVRRELASPDAAAPEVELVESVPVETLLDHAELRDAHEVWPEMIGAARSTLELAQFYLSNAPGSRLEPVVAAIEAALGRGVRVRVLSERKFVAVYPDTLARLARAGAEVRAFDSSARGGGILHAKIFVVDGREAFLGSQNFDWRALEHIYELGVRVRVPAIVHGLQAIFEEDWARSAPATDGGAATGQGAAAGSSGETAELERASHGAVAASQPGAVAGSRPAYLVASPPSALPAGIAWDLPELIALLDGAARSVRVQLLTYRAQAHGAAWDELEAPLWRAAERGVRVELLLADWSKRADTLAGLQRLVARADARRLPLEVRLITIPPWSGGFLPYARVSHAKLLLVDGARAWVGTSNWERDYFYQSRNVGVVLEDARLAAQLERFFLSAWQAPYAERLQSTGAYEAPRIQ
ncbi:MAG: phospholipase D-like domain-containing protein [Kofleriaceae bacterium]